MSADWVSRHIYWTDAQRRVIEVADYDGQNRRVVVSGDLAQPRGVAADPINGFVSQRQPFAPNNLQQGRDYLRNLRQTFGRELSARF